MLSVQARWYYICMSVEHVNSPEKPSQGFGSALIWKLDYLCSALPEECLEPGLHENQTMLSSKIRVDRRAGSQEVRELREEVSYVNDPISPEVVIDIFADCVPSKDVPLEPIMNEDGSWSMPYPGGKHSRREITVDRASGEVTSYIATSLEIPSSIVNADGSVHLDGEEKVTEMECDYDADCHREVMAILDSLS